MHNYKLHDKVCHIEMGVNDFFEVVGVRDDTVELFGDWSGGTNPYPGTQADWVHISKVVPYDDTKVITYDKQGNPQTHEERQKLKERNHLDSKADKDEVLIFVGLS